MKKRKLAIIKGLHKQLNKLDKECDDLFDPKDVAHLNLPEDKKPRWNMLYQKKMAIYEELETL